MIGSDSAIAEQWLRKGELVAIPTETVYGLAANAFLEEAVSKIYAVKGRPSFNPLIIHTNSIQKLESWGIELSATALQLARKFWPGPLTLVVPKSSQIPDMVTAGHPSVAIRIPAHPLALALLERLDFPLAAPSANLSGSVSPTTAKHVDEQLGNKIPYILDGGECKVGLESTIISCVHEKPRLLRLGGLSIHEIEAELGFRPEFNILNNENPMAPGMLSRHYAPSSKLVIGNAADYLNIFDSEQLVCIRFFELVAKIPKERQLVLSPNGNLDEAAAALYATIRKADAMKPELIVAEKFPEMGLGLTINDRLRRAQIQ